ncbi:hypothetical protein [Actinoplanes sp. NPDC051859]|uniref:hypothetical protein n=1 Tax=Actinoplanes sp. NPDC051859 TaxID=3363909 RepID=UPI00379B6BA9
MTGPEFSEVDFDLLADYVGGALDGTPDEAVVSALIVGHPAWRRAHAELSAATEAMTAALHSWGAEPEPMPADLVARLDAAFTPAASGSVPASATAATADATPARWETGDDATPIDSSADLAATPVTSASSVDATLVGSAAGGADSGVGDPRPSGDGVASVRRLVAVPKKEEQATTARKRARRLKWAAPIGIAAGVLAFAGFGIQQFGGENAEQLSTSAKSAADQQAPGVAALPAGPGQVLDTGTDYTAATLADAAAKPMAAAEAGPSTTGKPPADAPQPGLSPQAGTDKDDARKSRGMLADPSAGVMAERDDPLQRLRVQEVLLACIDAISDAHGAGAVTARSIDFARYDGTPALIVQFTAANGEWVWAAGADCGAPGSGAARLGAVKVG